MDAVRYQRLRALVHEAGHLPATERAAWLAARCPDEPALAREALSLLADALGATTGHLERPAASATWGLAPGTTLGPYRLGAELGRGGMGVVHEAHAPGRAGPVAIKVILPHLLSSTSAHERFKREARLGLALEHPNVVRTLDVGEADVGGQRFAFLAMERVHGRTFRALVQQLGALPEAWVRELMAQAAEGLAALHAAGIVHRDLKPENLILTDDRRVRVMDLGVAKSVESSVGLTAEGNFLGSPAYAAPEQCQGRAVGPAADLYALGCVLYELAAGTAPFASREPLALLRAHVDERPTPLAERNTGVSAFLAETAATLLAKAPGERFPSAAVLAQALREGEAGAWWKARVAGGLHPRRLPGAPRTLPLVGRDAELEALRAAWQRALQGQGGLVLLDAETGLGATRLLAELLHDVGTQAAAQVVHAACGDTAAVPAPAEALLAHLGAAASPEALAARLAVATEVASTWRAQLERRPLAPGQSALPAASVDGLLTRLVRSVATEQPLLLVVEDVHAADAERRREVLACARAAESARALVVVSARPDLDAAWRARLLGLPGTSVVALARLGHEDLVKLFHAAVGDLGMARRLARVLGPRADGVPLFALELLRDVERRTAAGAPTPDDLEGAPSPPRALRDLVRARLAEVPEALRVVLDAAAVMGRDVDPARLARALGRERVDVLEALGALERRFALLRSGPRLFRFPLALVREAVVAEVPQAVRAELHDRLADAWAVDADLEEGERAAQVAAHRLRGARPTSARDTLAPALAHLHRAGRSAERAELLKLALDAPGLLDEPARVDHLVMLAQDSGMLGQLGEEERLLHEAQALAKRLGDRKRQAFAAMQLGYLRLRLGDFERAEQESRATRTLCLGDPKQEAAAVGVVGKALWCLGRLEEARACHTEALAIAARAPTPVTLARARADLAIVLQELGLSTQALEHLEAALPVLREIGDRRNLSAALADTANTLLTLGRSREALPLYEEALAIARSDGLLGAEANVLTNLAELRMRAGRLEEARADLEACLGLARETGERRVEGYAAHGLARLDAWLGERESAERWYASALALRRAMHNRAAEAETLLELGQLDLDAGEHDRARTRLLDALEAFREVGDVNGAQLAHASLARIAPEHVAAAQEARRAAGDRLRPEVLLETASLLWRATADPAELASAQALTLEAQAQIPDAWRGSLRARVPYVACLPTA